MFGLPLYLPEQWQKLSLNRMYSQGTQKSGRKNCAKDFIGCSQTNTQHISVKCGSSLKKSRWSYKFSCASSEAIATARTSIIFQIQCAHVHIYICVCVCFNLFIYSFIYLFIFIYLLIFIYIYLYLLVFIYLYLFFICLINYVIYVQLNINS